MLAATSGLAPLERVQRREAGASHRRQVSLEHPPGLISTRRMFLGARASNVRCCPVGGDADLAQLGETRDPGLAAAADA